MQWYGKCGDMPRAPDGTTSFGVDRLMRIKEPAEEYRQSRKVDHIWQESHGLQELQGSQRSRRLVAQGSLAGCCNI